MLAIIVPVLQRPQNVAPLLASIEATTPQPHRVLFVCDPGDIPEQDAIARAGGAMISPGGNYAAKIRAGILATDEPIVFLGADDLTFLPGWFEAAAVSLTDPVQVVGVNDLIARRSERRGHATHFLMTRTAALMPTIADEPGPLCPLYDHSFCDDELIATAKHRGMYAYVLDSHVRHIHPSAGGEDDDVYRKGRMQFRQDRRIFTRRMHLWT